MSNTNSRLNPRFHIVVFKSTGKDNLVMHGNAKLPGTIGKKMQKYRKRAGLTQENLAEKVKVSGAYIGHIEQGRNAPSLELLERVSRVLRIPLKELF